MKNIGTPERVVRIVVGLVVIGWGLFAKNWWGALGLVLLLTGLIGWCGLYQVMGTCCPFSKKGEGKKDNESKSCGCGCSAGKK
jgi:hypothetical protein